MVPAIVIALASSTLESRTLVSFDDGKDKWRYMLSERIVANGRITISTRDVSYDGTIGFSHREYDMSGRPLVQWQEGYWNDRWNRFESTYTPKGATLDINGEKTRSKLTNAELANPTVLWFWKVQPKIGEVKTVTFMAQNVPTTFQIKLTYEGDEEMELAGKKARLHRVREDPLGAKGVYTIWWYDDQGMGVKRYHKTTQHEYNLDLKAWR
jgi:hypothetical protein